MIEIVSTFKDRLNQALSIRNMKPIELSEKTGISESTISQYRSGYAKPKDDKLVVISNALNVNPVWLMGLNVSMVIESTAEADKTNKDIEIYSQIEGLTPEKRDALLKYLAFLLSDA